MKLNTIRKRALEASSALNALALVGVGAVATVALPTVASAQDYTRGNVTGTVVDEAGAPISGATVSVTSEEQGFTNTTTTDAAGSFRVTSLPTGSYTVTVEQAGAVVVRTTGVRVLAGQANNSRYIASTTPTEIVEDGNAIVVVGTRVQTNDFAATQTGVTLDVQDLAETVPVGRDATSLILLAPGTTSGDSGFGNLASIGGATVAENAYYVNGLNITNFRTFLGGGRVPFEFYRTLDVKTGGYQAEYGRALGGVTSAVTKSGSNNLEGGAVVIWDPNFLSENKANTVRYNSNTDQFEVANLNDDDYSESIDANFYLSGPLIKDRVFFYGLYNPGYYKSGNTSLRNGLRYETDSDSPFYGGKLDAVITDGHRLEFTYFRDEETVETKYLTVDDMGDVTGNRGTVTNQYGGDNFIGNYTGQFTDWFTLSLAYGQYNDKSVQKTDPNNPVVLSNVGPGGQVAGTVIGDVEESNKRELYRADADIFVDFAGEHHFRVGFDYEDLTAGETTSYTGPLGTYYTLYNSYMFRRFYFNQGEFNTKQRAFYAQDSWSLMDGRVNLQLGIRNDRFKNYTQEGQLYYDSGDNWAPRLGASFDVFGDGRTKLNAFWGRYYLPVATNTNIRLAGKELYVLEALLYPAGVGGDADNNAIPDGLTFDENGVPADGGTFVGSLTCPEGTPNAGGACYRVYGDGTLGAVDTLVSSTLQPSYTDEWIIGAEHRMGDWTFSLNYINRRLGQTLEDAAIDAAVNAYCSDNGIAGCSSVFTGYHQYTLLNPGSDVTVRLDGDCSIAGQCDVVTLAAEDLGYPKAKRNYDSVQFEVDKAFNGLFGFNASYVWTKLEGNFEGAVKSDNNQSDAGLTQDFDQPGFLDGAYGPLANQRKHSFKFSGNVKPADWINIGARFTLESPRKFSCIGNYYDANNFAYGYGAASYYCLQDGYGGTAFTNSGYDEVNGTADDSTSYLIPRGSAFESDWKKTLDLSFRLTPFESMPGVAFQADIFNVFNWQAETDYYEFGDYDFDLETPHPDYGVVTDYQSPRSVRLSLFMRFGGDN